MGTVTKLNITGIFFKNVCPQPPLFGSSLEYPIIYLLSRPPIFVLGIKNNNSEIVMIRHRAVKNSYIGISIASKASS